MNTKLANGQKRGNGSMYSVLLSGSMLGLIILMGITPLTVGDIKVRNALPTRE